MIMYIKESLWQPINTCKTSQQDPGPNDRDFTRWQHPLAKPEEQGLGHHLGSNDDKQGNEIHCQKTVKSTEHKAEQTEETKASTEHNGNIIV